MSLGKFQGGWPWQTKLQLVRSQDGALLNTKALGTSGVRRQAGSDARPVALQPLLENYNLRLD